MDVLCIGHAAYDVILPLAHFPVEDRKYALPHKRECGGGPAANAAFLLAKWGSASMFMGQLGDDVYGRTVIKELEEAGVDLSLLQINPSCPTPYSTILVNTRSGSRTILNVRQPPQPLKSIARLNAEQSPRVLLMDGHEPEASLKALELFPHAVSILDAGSVKEGTLRLASQVDYLIASESFALEHCQIHSLNSDTVASFCLQKLQQLGKGQIVITMGGQGLLYWTEGKTKSLSAYPVNALDTTGAGDVFHGAFAYGVLHGYSLLDNLRFSSAAAALSVQSLGGRISIPELDQVRLFYHHSCLLDAQKSHD
jgi:sulfofructose kinase